MKDWFRKNKYTIWYALCFLLLGIIDQRKGSATGRVQMVFVNLTGVAIAGMLMPSLKKVFYRWKGFQIWALAACVLTPLACIIGDNYWDYAGQWYTAMLNVALITGLILYIVWDWKAIRAAKRLNKACFLSVMLMLLLMSLSVHIFMWPRWFLFLFGCFYLIGVPKHLENEFMLGMLYGFGLWFLAQQTIAFAFRPYDYVRYRGLYAGETQSGLFYMIIFCAFLCIWLYKKQRKEAVWQRVICFVLLSGAVSFILMTGGRSSLVGAVLAACVGLIGYDIIFCQSFRHWLLQGIAIGLCAIMLLPAVYGCVRYLPTILHHPIWFEGDYNEETSVHAYDPWNSERYVTFEEMIYYNIGRILDVVGIKLELEDDKLTIAESPFLLRAYAAEQSEPGDSPENPFVVKLVREDLPPGSSINVRKIIAVYTLKHLNLKGHAGGAVEFYLEDGECYAGHLHNIFLQIGYNFGIIPGVLFLFWNIWCICNLLRQRNMNGLCATLFLVAILVYGLTEMAVTIGQISLVILFVLYYWGMQKRDALK